MLRHQRAQGCIRPFVVHPGLHLAVAQGAQRAGGRQGLLRPSRRPDSRRGDDCHPHQGSTGADGGPCSRAPRYLRPGGAPTHEGAVPHERLPRAADPAFLARQLRRILERPILGLRRTGPSTAPGDRAAQLPAAAVADDEPVGPGKHPNRLVYGKARFHQSRWAPARSDSTNIYWERASYHTFSLASAIASHV